MILDLRQFYPGYTNQRQTLTKQAGLEADVPVNLIRTGGFGLFFKDFGADMPPPCQIFRAPLKRHFLATYFIGLRGPKFLPKRGIYDTIF